ncbi:methionyl aminopeptidase [Nematocida displodere]|uniref:Methionyl aminopeptidase n=1 Tax=Nematocida displodere TaxID=1805483 RepID=A0A177EFN8_9MICR|nr:methionyl aminopeptidase [Nematocida displodere]
MTDNKDAVLLKKTEQPVIECLLSESERKKYSIEGSTLHAPSSHEEMLECARLAAEAHRRARYAVQQMIKPGVSLLEIANTVENSTRTLLGTGYNQGIGFPTGLSLNACAAHDSPNPKSKTVLLQENDVLKVDFGTQVNGYIIDSAFTVTFNPEYESLLRASQEAVYECLKLAGPDTRLKDIGEKAEEIMRSYEVMVNGRETAIRPVTNLNGHTINRYKIHGGKYVPIVKNSGVKDRMVEGEFYAIETFATTGKGYVIEKGDCSHYMISNPNALSKLSGGKSLLDYIKKTFHTLPFCKRYIDPTITMPDVYLSHLTKVGAVEAYPPLVDTPGSLVSQFEHTLFIKSAGIEVLSKGDDY